MLFRSTPKVLSGDWKTWSNGEWNSAIQTVLRGTFDGMNYPPIKVDWLEDSMLHLLAGTYYQDELAKLKDIHGREHFPIEKSTQLGLMVQEARAELYALRQMGVIQGEDIDKAIGGMDRATRNPEIGLAARPIFDAPTEDPREYLHRDIFKGKGDFSRRSPEEKAVTKQVKKMTEQGYTPEQILDFINQDDPDNPKYSLDDVKKMIGDTTAAPLPSWMHPDRKSNKTPNFDPANGVYADWSPEPGDDKKTLKEKALLAEIGRAHV